MNKPPHILNSLTDPLQTINNKHERKKRRVIYVPGLKNIKNLLPPLVLPRRRRHASRLRVPRPRKLILVLIRVKKRIGVSKMGE